MKLYKVSLSDHNKIVEEFKNESDRGAAVLAGSLVENYLAKYMKSKMIDDGAIDDLFHGFGPFSTFSQRYKSAYAFGLISIQQKKVLSKIQDIRNEFAHSPFIATFEGQKISNLCKSISIKSLLPEPNNVADDFSNLDNRTRYIIAISLLVADWELKMTHKGKTPP